MDSLLGADQIHDLGHPPFGHIAEQELNKCVNEASGSNKVHDGYEGNAQSFMIVTMIESRRDDRTALNLTFATLNASLKYPWFRVRDPEDKRSRKWGVYLPLDEKDAHDSAIIFNRSQKSLPQAHRNEPCLEAEVMDWADDIAYSVHDLEDFVRAGLIPLYALAVDDQVRVAVGDQVRARWALNGSRKTELARTSVLQGLSRMLESDMISKHVPSPLTHGLSTADGKLKAMSSALISYFLSKTKLKESGDRFRLEVPEDVRNEARGLQELIWHFVIEHPALAAQQHGKAMVIRNLFGIYFEALDKDRWSPYLLPRRWHDHRWLPDAITTDKKLSDGQRARLAADVVSSFTDQEALLMHRKLTGTLPGSISDRVS